MKKVGLQTKKLSFNKKTIRLLKSPNFEKIIGGTIVIVLDSKVGCATEVGKTSCMQCSLHQTCGERR